MQSRAVTLLITVATLLSQTDGRLSNAPQDTESKVGDTTYFNCSTNITSREIFWNHGDEYVYSENGILPPYDERFEIDRNESDGSYNLVIRSVEPSDAGEYICIDDDGHGTRRSAQLVVLENDPDCQSNIQPDGVIGQNVFNIAPDEVQLTCTVNYHGNILPQMEWKTVGDNDSANSSNVTSHVRSDNCIIYTLNLKGDMSLDNSSYVCQTKRSAHDQYKCYSKAIKILYFVSGNMTERNAFRGDEITCIADNNTFNCSNQWYHDNYNTCPLSCEKIIKAHLIGAYLCRVKCYVRGNDYPFDVLKAVVAEPPTSPSPSFKGELTAAFVTPTVIIIFISVLIVVCLVRRNKRIHDRMAQIEAERKWLLQEECEVELRHKIKKEATAEENTIRGVAILERKLFLMHENSSKLQIYDLDQFNAASPKSVSVREVCAAVDICSCKKNDCLYIMNKKVLEMHEVRNVIRVRADGTVLDKWPTENNACGFLSATKEGNVIITVPDNHTLLEYSYERNLARKIILSECIRPWHAIKLDDDRYVVSHGIYEKPNRVCIVDKNGSVNKAFGDKMGPAANQLHIPYYLAVGSSSCVFVADFCNNRVLLLDSNLEYKSKIVPKYEQRFRSPRRIYLDDGLLVVVIGSGIPRKKIFLDPWTLTREIKPAATLMRNDDPEKSIHGEGQDSKKETDEGVALRVLDDHKETNVVEGKDSWNETEENAILMENVYPKGTTLGEAHCSGTEAVEDATLKGIDNPKEAIHSQVNEQDLIEEMDSVGYQGWLRKYTKVVDVQQRIEEDCILVVFDIKQLMENSLSTRLSLIA